MSTPPVSRRSLLKGSALLGGSALLSGLPAAAGRNPYGPFRMGIQSYSLRGYKLEEALAHTKSLGLGYWEAFGGHIPLTTKPEEVAAIKEKLRACDVRLMAHGVNGFGADAAANRRIFEAAQALGVRVLSADPSPQALDGLEKLVDEFDINIAIHNHGPGSRYDKIKQVVDAVKDRHRRIGACVDTGHFLRSREDPVRALEELSARVFGVHLKDVKDATRFTVLGKGDLDLDGCLRRLKRMNFREVMALEYEENPRDPLADIRECLQAVRASVDRL